MEWRAVPSTNNLIEVSDIGLARRVRRPLVYKDGRSGFLPAADLRLTLRQTGYLSVSFTGKHLMVHRLMAEVFLPEPAFIYAKQTVNHKNGVKTDNSVDNLEWATYKENNGHARSEDLNLQHGENTNFSKYSDQFIQAVRNVHAVYNPTWAKLGAMFGLTGTHAKQIVERKTRKRPTGVRR